MDRSKVKSILLSRVDNLGDAVLLLPAAGVLKQHYPTSRLLFLGQSYQREIIESCRHFDAFLDWDEVRDAPLVRQADFLAGQHIDVIVHVKPRRPIATAAKMAKIPHRIGSADRIYHFLSCNHRPIQVRRWSKLHETQMNIRLLAPLLNRVDYAVDELESFLGFDRFGDYPDLAGRFLSKDRFNLVLHPLSLGHAKEWPVARFLALIQLLPSERYNILVTGTRKEGAALREGLLVHCKDRVHDLTGKLTVSELVSLISQADGLVAASTGPLHIAAAAGIHTLGLYVQKWQLHPGRYGPIGRHASVMVYDEHCPVCLADKECDCIKLITPERVFAKISEWTKLNGSF
ncbi:MAG: glycosyltransferase family 9 protein [Gammaproteobacteria bacterium]|nr:glycosyltransferase family 9 protein [Gammaproteobacteria bacterium]